MKVELSDSRKNTESTCLPTSNIIIKDGEKRTDIPSCCEPNDVSNLQLQWPFYIDSGDEGTTWNATTLSYNCDTIPTSFLYPTSLEGLTDSQSINLNQLPSSGDCVSLCTSLVSDHEDSNMSEYNRDQNGQKVILHSIPSVNINEANVENSADKYAPLDYNRQDEISYLLESQERVICSKNCQTAGRKYCSILKSPLTNLRLLNGSLQSDNEITKSTKKRVRFSLDADHPHPSLEAEYGGRSNRRRLLDFARRQQLRSRAGMGTDDMFFSSVDSVYLDWNWFKSLLTLTKLFTAPTFLISLLILISLILFLIVGPTTIYVFICQLLSVFHGGVLSRLFVQPLSIEQLLSSLSDWLVHFLLNSTVT